MDERINLVISRANKKNSKKKQEITTYEKKELEKIDKNSFEIELYHCKRTNPNSWNGFLEKVMKDKNEVKLWNNNHDFIVFIYDKHDMFCFTGGVGHNGIDDVCDEDFPLNLMLRLVDPEKIKQAKSRGLTGIFYARDFYFRGNHTISATEAFGSVWKDVRATLRKEVASNQDWVDIIGESKNGEINCDVKKSFRIRRRISFKDAIRLIEKIQNELKRELTAEEEKSFYFVNSVKLITNIQEKETLNAALLQVIYDKIKTKSFNLDYDFCHTKFENYYDANLYEAKRHKTLLASWDEMPDVNEVFSKLNGRINIETFDNFKTECTKSIKIKTSHDDDIFNNTSSSLFDHIHGELEFQNHNYFLLDKQWYLVENDFLSVLQDDFRDYISNGETLIDTIDLNQWPISMSEGTYNESHLSKDNFFVADRILLRGIELFDLLYVDNDDVYIIHVKDGLSSSTRDVCSQLRNAARIIEDKNTEKVQEFEDRLLKTKVVYSKNTNYKTKLPNYTNGELQKLLKDKKRHYVVAFRYGNNADDIIKCNSNITRFELLGLRDDLRRYGTELKLYQIKE